MILEICFSFMRPPWRVLGSNLKCIGLSQCQTGGETHGPGQWRCLPFPWVSSDPGPLAPWAFWENQPKRQKALAKVSSPVFTSASNTGRPSIMARNQAHCHPGHSDNVKQCGCRWYPPVTADPADGFFKDSFQLAILNQTSKKSRLFEVWSNKAKSLMDLFSIRKLTCRLQFRVLTAVLDSI